MRFTEAAGTTWLVLSFMHPPREALPLLPNYGKNAAVSGWRAVC